MLSRFLRALLHPRSLGALWRDVRLSVRLLRDPAVPWWTKLVLPIALLYLVSPLDLVPDVIVGIGEIDDLLILYGAMQLFVSLCPSTVTSFHRDALNLRRRYTPMPPAEVVIDAEFRRDN